jgi:hypothetical protein
MKLSLPVSTPVLWLLGAAVAVSAGAFAIFATPLGDIMFPTEDTPTPSAPLKPLSSVLPSYLDTAHDELVAQKASFISIDLTAMSLTYYQKGEPVLITPVQAKASDTTWWQTPAGYYEVHSKILEHKSSFGNVSTKWNLPFQGNFFIHGWPRFPSGRLATSPVSGGCMRLADEAAEELYRKVEYGTPIIITEERYTKPRTYTLLKDVSIESEAKSLLALDLESGNILLARGENARLPVGDIGTLLSAIMTVEHIGIDHAMYGVGAINDNGRITDGEKYRVFDMLFPLLEDWSHEVEGTVASYMGKEQFEERLQYKARALGIAPEHVSFDPKKGVLLDATPLELANLAHYTYLYRNFLFEISSSDLIIYLYGYPTTGRRTYPRIFPGFEDFKGGVYDKDTGSVMALFDLSAHGGGKAMLFVSLYSDDPLQDVVEMRQAVIDAKHSAE